LEELRSEGGEAMVLENNYFIEEILPNAILRRLSDEEMREYRRPFAEPGEGRRPTLTWPVAGEPADVHAIATECADWLGTSNVPKLFLKVTSQVRSSPLITWSTSSARGQRSPRRRWQGSISFRKIRRTRSGGLLPAGC
jgi:hypothetical protein